MFIPVGSDNSFLVADLVAGTVYALVVSDAKKLESVTDFNSVIKRPPQQVKVQIQFVSNIETTATTRPYCI